MITEEKVEITAWQEMANQATMEKNTDVKVPWPVTGKLYVWQSTQNGKWYRSGIANNGENCLPSQGYTTKQSAESLDAVRRFVVNPEIVYGMPPKRKYTRRQKKRNTLSRLLEMIRNTGR